MAIVKFERAILMQCRDGKTKKGENVQYIKIADTSGEYSFSSKEVDFSKVPTLEPMGFILDIEAGQYNGNTFFTVKSADIKEIKRNGSN